MIRFAESKQDQNTWLVELIGRRNSNIEAVALANKYIRINWAMMTRGEVFNPAHTSQALVPI